MTDKNITLSDADIQWHPAFCAAAELELSANRTDLDFQREYNLSKKPLQIDLLVIRKRDNARVENEIGHIFRRYNIIEYKSPGDALSVDDFFKTVGYACIYKGLGERTDQIPADQLTVPLFREEHPREMFSSLEKYGFPVKKKYPGVYYIEGLFIPAQVVVTKELESGRHLSLKVLSRNAKEDDIRGFVENVRKLTGQGELANVDAILQVSVQANHERYEEMKRRFPAMCEALKMLMWDEIEDEVQKGIQKQARQTAYKLHDMGMPADKIAGAVSVSLETVQKWFAEQAAPAKPAAPL